MQPDDDVPDEDAPDEDVSDEDAPDEDVSDEDVSVEDNQPMISGDVQSGQFVQAGMQPQTVIIDPNTGLPQNVIIMEQPSSAPKVVGIFVIIYGAILGVLSLIGLLGISLITDPDNKLYHKEVADSPTMMYLLIAVLVICCAGQIVGGVFMTQRKRLGIQLIWLTILVSFIADIAMEMLYPEYIASQPGSMDTSINIAFSGVCSLICGLIAAIPLMITGHDMDDTGFNF